MHTEVKQLIKRVRKEYPEYFYFSSVLEFGSQNINGSPRKYFWFCNYKGIDLAKGKGVDVVCPAHLYEGNAMCVMSTEMLEHDYNWKSSLCNMYNNLIGGGLMIVTCAAPERPEHGTKRTSPQDSPFTNDYYQNISKEDFISVLPKERFTEYHLTYERNRQDLLFWGIKNHAPIMMQNYN